MEKAKFNMGERLLHNNIITQIQLAEALDYQKKQLQDSGIHIKLGSILVKMGFCTDEDIACALSQNTGYQLMSLNKKEVDMSAANLISPEIASKYRALPIGFENGKLLVAMERPDDLLTMDDFRLITGYDIKPIVVTDDELKAVLERFCNISRAIESDEEEEDESETQSIVEDNDQPAVILATQIINAAVRAGASDIHVEPLEKYFRVRYRIDGVLHEMMQQPTSMFASLVSRIKIISNIDIAERRIPQDGRATVKVDGNVVDIRVATLPSAYGERITMRLLSRSNRVITVEELGFPQVDYNRFMHTITLPYGFLLVTGPTGSGKSTTLYASLAQLNSIEKNVITLEDPIERRMEGLNQVQMNEKAGMTFASGLRSILRSDPDIVMIGEIRDKETAKIAVEAALTGHFVLSTLHTNDAASAVTRLGEMGVDNFLTASSLVGVIAQRLVRKLCPKCKEAYVMTKEEMAKSHPEFPMDEDSITIYRSKGCLSCNNTGYKGRCGTYEFLEVSDEIRNLILKNGSDNEIKNVAISQGMTTLRDDGYDKVRRGITSIEEVLRVIV
ncbi:MAG: ATPase, T2SS/T4P/T4SS family [Oscillospiraceae bacterium]